jgi:hypothetical protein
MNTDYIYISYMHKLILSRFKIKITITDNSGDNVDLLTLRVRCFVLYHNLINSAPALYRALLVSRLAYKSSKLQMYLRF